MQIDDTGLKFIAQREAYSATPYQDAGGIYTIGYGHTEGVTAASPILTRDQALTVLENDIEEFEDGVTSLVSVNVTQNEFNALVSLAFNIGLGNFKASSVLVKLNNGDKLGAAKAFLFWNEVRDPKTGRKKIDIGLVKRRQMESDLFAQDTLAKKDAVEV